VAQTYLEEEAPSGLPQLYRKRLQAYKTGGFFMNGPTPTWVQLLNEVLGVAKDFFALWELLKDEECSVLAMKLTGLPNLALRKRDIFWSIKRLVAVAGLIQTEAPPDLQKLLDYREGLVVVLINALPRPEIQMLLNQMLLNKALDAAGLLEGYSRVHESFGAVRDEARRRGYDEYVEEGIKALRRGRHPLMTDSEFLQKYPETYQKEKVKSEYMAEALTKDDVGRALGLEGRRSLQNYLNRLGLQWPPKNSS
jgi:hypothetical protein